MNIVKHCARVSASVLALATVMPAFAQSTGQQDFDQQTIVVTGVRGVKAVNGFVAPETSRAKETLTQEIIQRSSPGQTILDTINLVPGVSFQNNDAYGSGGGTLNVRGFDSSRVSLNWDGLPLNDTGNYALYSNQQLDPELIGSVTVSLGSTDVDAPTAAASGSSINYVTRNPTEDFHVQVMGSAGDYDLMRVFGVVDTGTFTSAGTRAFLSASKQTYNNPFNNVGKLNKQQFNAKIYQPIGSNGDFISLAGHFNQNRNNFFGSAPLRTDLTQNPLSTTPRTPGTGTTNRFPMSAGERNYYLQPCTTTVAGGPGRQAATSCGSAFDYRYNPSDTGNARLNSRFTLTDKLVLTFDAGYQYVLANGGGTVTANEGRYVRATSSGSSAATPTTGYVGYFSGQPYFGRDLNGDGDTSDQVLLAAPSNTQTHRAVANLSLRYSFTPDHTVRVGYSLDWARHRQTGEVGPLKINGMATDPFTGNHAMLDVDGNPLQKRDRLSYAILHQAFGEYRGQFFDRRLTVTAGLRAPFFTRDLTNNCFATSGGGFVDCTGGNTAENADYATRNPRFAAPQNRVLHYNKVLPEAGLVFNLTPKASIFANYAKGMQVPGTDNLYQTFFYAPGTPGAFPKPETTDNFDVGARFKSGKIQAQLDGWYTIFHNRLASSYDPVLDVTIYRNLGTVHKYGIDGSISYQPIEQFSIYAWGSYMKSKILENVNLGGGSNVDCSNASIAGLTADQIALSTCGFTKGKRESGAPTFTLGVRGQANLGPLTVGLTAKRTGPRYVNDQNLPIYAAYCTNGASGTCSSTAPVGSQTRYYQVYGKKIPAYTLVNLDARLSANKLGIGQFNERTYLQLNIYNLFNKFYAGGVGGGNTSATALPFTQIGVPRTISGTFSIGF